MIRLPREEAMTLADLVGVYIPHASPDRAGPAYVLAGSLRRAERCGIGAVHFNIIGEALRYASDLPADTRGKLRSTLLKFVALAEELPA